MGELTKIPPLFTPTFIPDLKDTLNGSVNNGKVTDDLTSFFRPEANINMWSRRKPVINKAIGVLTTEEMATSGVGTDFTFYGTARYGITIVGGAAITPADIYKSVKFFGNGAKYFLPEGGESEPYRLSDFNGYYPAAAQPLEGSISGNVTINQLSGQDKWDFAFFMRTSDTDSDELSFADLYPTDGVDENVLSWRTGLVLVNKANEDDVRVVLGAFDADFTDANKGKTFYGVQFITSYAGAKTPSASDQAWKNSVQYAIPEEIFELTIKETSSGGGTGVQNSIKITVTNGYPKFTGISTDPFGTVTTKFKLTKTGGNGDVKEFTVGLYPSSACNLADRLAVVEYGDKNINTSASFTATLNNPLAGTASQGEVWVGIYFNYNLQHVKKVAMPRQERPTAI